MFSIDTIIKESFQIIWGYQRKAYLFINELEMHDTAHSTADQLLGCCLIKEPDYC